MLEAGVAQRKNVINMLFLNVIDVCIAAIVFWLFGFAFAFGCTQDCGHKFLGDNYFAMINTDSVSSAGGPHIFSCNGKEGGGKRPKRSLTHYSFHSCFALPFASGYMNWFFEVCCQIREGI